MQTYQRSLAYGIRQVISYEKRRKNVLSTSLLTSISQRHVTTSTSSILKSDSGRLTSYHDINVKPGDKLHGYTVNHVTAIDEFQLTAIELRHDIHGSRHLHIARSDPNNVFAVAFRTPPTNDEGVSHILEHTVLCGSEEYPVRDPFFKMLTRSLSTFMNAWTAHEFTMYPFSTQNAKDYSNLMSVYLDAAFFPLISKSDFKQEGHRLENTDPFDKSTPLIFKGVVYNEMKGALSNAEALFGEAMQKHLFPAETYKYIAGGSPPAILDLTHETLQKFHAETYSPANAYFYTYGDLPLETHLEHIQRQVLSVERSWSSKISQPPPKPGARWTSPRRVNVTCASDPMAIDKDRQSRAAVAFLVNDANDLYESFALRVLSTLMTAGPQSPFYQSLLAPNIGTNYSPGVGYFDQGGRDAAFSIGLQGINDADVPRMESIINDTFEKVAKEGFPRERTDAVLHQLELQLRQQSSSFGLNLGAGLMGPWLRECAPQDLLRATPYLEKLRADIERGGFFEGLVKRYFIGDDKVHKLTLVQSPDPDYATKAELEESRILAERVAALTESDLEDTFQNGLKLQEEQGVKDDVSLLPTIHASDISRDPEKMLTSQRFFGATDISITSTEQLTNGLSFFRALVPVNTVPEDLRPLMPFFSRAATQLGTSTKNFEELSQAMELSTGGFGMSLSVNPALDDDSKLSEGLLLSSNCLLRNINPMMALWEDMYNGIRFHDIQERVETLVAMCANELAGAVVDSGHSFAASHAASAISPIYAAREQYTGLSQVAYIQRLAQSKDTASLLNQLKQLASTVLVPNDMTVLLHSDIEGMENLNNATDAFFMNVGHQMNNSGSTSTTSITRSLDSSKLINTFFELPTPVNFCARALRGVPAMHPDYPILTVLAALTTWRYLHKEIREKGGAYGASASAGEGSFILTSYRDPHILDTIDTFANCAEWACDASNYTERDVEESIFSVVAKLDAPAAPGKKGVSDWVRGTDFEVKRTMRHRLLDTTKEDVLRVARLYLRDGWETGTNTVLGGAANAHAAGLESKGWEIRSILC